MGCAAERGAKAPRTPLRASCCSTTERILATEDIYNEMQDVRLLFAIKGCYINGGRACCQLPWRISEVANYMKIFIGTAGFLYKDWEGIVYPADLKKQKIHPLQYMARFYDCC